MKRLLFEVHRWTGIVLALFMTLWFATGVVILYAGYTPQNRLQQQAHADALTPESGWLSLGQAWSRSAEQRKDSTKETGKADGKDSVGVPVEARLIRQNNEPVWLTETDKGQHYALSARDGSLLSTDANEAVAIAQQWIAHEPDLEKAQARYLETLDKTSLVRNLDDYKPFHRIALDDSAGTQLFVSAKTGEVVNVSTRLQRGMMWAGNWLHLFRPIESLGGTNDNRRDVLLWFAGFTVLATLTGLIIGWLRWRPSWGRKSTYSEGRTQPYRAFWFKWHFWAGLIGGIVALTWAVSGFFNGNPWQIFSPANPTKPELARFYGGNLPRAMADWKPASSRVPDGVVELAWRRIGDQAALLAVSRDGNRTPLTVDGAVTGFDQAALKAAGSRLGKGSEIATIQVLNDYDSYYYPRHGRGLADRPLPVVQVDLADAGHNRLYIDPADGRLLLKQDDSRRAFRWLFNALHYWDFGWLYQRPLWDAWSLAWIGFGLVLSVSSVVIGWRRLKNTFRAKKPKTAAIPVGKSPEPQLATESAT
jgi:uncharacterized iron-regulated membrane protein